MLLCVVEHTNKFIHIWITEMDSSQQVLHKKTDCAHYSFPLFRGFFFWFGWELGAGRIQKEYYLFRRAERMNSNSFCACVNTKIDTGYGSRMKMFWNDEMKAKDEREKNAQKILCVSSLICLLSVSIQRK